MIGKIISPQRLVAIRNRDYPYAHALINWLSSDEDTPSKYRTIYTSYCHLRGEKDWDTMGREIRNQDHISTHAHWISQILLELEVGKVLVQFKNPRHYWFGNTATRRHNRSRIDYLRSLSGGENLDAATFHGGIVFESVPIKFIDLFIDFPHEDSRGHMQIFCGNCPLLVEFSNHLDVFFASSDHRILRKISKNFQKAGFKKLDYDPVIFVHPDVTNWFGDEP